MINSRSLRMRSFKIRRRHCVIAQWLSSSRAAQMHLASRGGAHLQEPTVGFRPWEGIRQEVDLHASRLTLDAPMAIRMQHAATLQFQNLNGADLRAGH